MTAGDGSAAASGQGLSIGGVLKRLREDFPDVTISKIRFLETEGLVTPARRASGYRSFSSDDVERLRYILTAQRDRFWPLKVIREALDAMDRGLQPEDVAPASRPAVPAPVGDPSLPGAAELRAGRPLRMTATEVREGAGLDEEAFTALETFGLIRADQDGHFDEQALVVARESAALASFGIEPRHLRLFRMAADREVGLIDQVLGPMRHRGKAAPRQAASQDAETEILAHGLALHVSLVRSALRSRG